MFVLLYYKWDKLSHVSQLWLTETWNFMSDEI